MLTSPGSSLTPALVFHFTETLGPTESGVATRNSVKGDSGVVGIVFCQAAEVSTHVKKLAQTQAIISAWLVIFPPC